VGYVDLHAHFLPALDDGSPDLPTSHSMLAGLRAIGYDTVCATPHQKASQFLPAADHIHGALSATRQVLPDGLELHLGAENYWDEVLFERMRAGTVPRYDDGRAFLFEIPTGELPVRLEETLFQERIKGLLPVMAHPERYRPFWSDLDRVARLGGSIALVVDLGAVAGYHGAQPAKMARRLLEQRIAHAAASDVHSVSDVRSAAEGIAWVRKRLGDDAVRRLMADNPRRILLGELPDP
jgi:protein-tyrosine phosphatase